NQPRDRHLFEHGLDKESGGALDRQAQKQPDKGKRTTDVRSWFVHDAPPAETYVADHLGQRTSPRGTGPEKNRCIPTAGKDVPAVGSGRRPPDCWPCWSPSSSRRRGRWLPWR